MLTTLFVDGAAGAAGDGSPASPFQTIQEAVDAAAQLPGEDTVAIAAGVYAENIEIEDSDGVTLAGQGDVTIKHPDIDLQAGEEPEDIIESEGDVSFRNLNLEGLFIGQDLGGRGIDAKDGDVALTNVHIAGTDGDALRVRDFGSLSVQNSSFYSINADGMDLEDGGSVRISNTDANNNDDEGLEVDRVDSIVVLNGHFSGNGDDGVDIDDSTEIRIINIVSTGNAGNGFQVESEIRNVARVTVIGSRFDDNGESGIEIVNRDPVSIALLELFGNHSTNNTEFAFDIDIAGAVVAHGNRASGNGDDTLP